MRIFKTKNGGNKILLLRKAIWETVDGISRIKEHSLTAKFTRDDKLGSGVCKVLPNNPYEKEILALLEKCPSVEEVKAPEIPKPDPVRPPQPAPSKKADPPSKKL